jgi:anti-sigma regulatory factor (Ser/Thr protein kinase)
MIVKYLAQHMPTLTSDQLYDIRIVLGEIMANGLVHTDPSDRPIVIDIVMKQTKIRIEIKDGGNGFDLDSTYQAKKELIDGRQSFNIYPNGMGIYIIKKIHGCYLTNKVLADGHKVILTFIPSEME